MKSFPVATILTTLFLLTDQGGYACANPIYFDFQSLVYPGSNSGQSGDPLAPGSVVNFAPALPASQAGAWLESSAGTQVAGSGSINIANLGWQVSPSNDWFPGTPSPFNAQPFEFALTLTDDASHAQGTLYFQGTFSLVPGYAGNVDSGILSLTPSIQTLDLGHNSYTVDLSQQTTWVTQQQWELMAAYGGGYDVQAQVTVQPLSIQAAPEPSSLLLACLGLAPLGLSRWLRRRRKDVESNS